MSTLDIQYSVYYAPAYGQPEKVLDQGIWSDSDIEVGSTFRFPLTGGNVDDDRPLYFGLRRVAGDTSPIGLSLFTIRVIRLYLDNEGVQAVESPGPWGARLPKKGEAVQDFPIQIDVDTAIGADTNWHGYYLGHIGHHEMQNIVVTWGDSSLPTPSL